MPSLVHTEHSLLMSSSLSEQLLNQRSLGLESPLSGLEHSLCFQKTKI